MIDEYPNGRIRNLRKRHRKTLFPSHIPEANHGNILWNTLPKDLISSRNRTENPTLIKNGHSLHHCSFNPVEITPQNPAQ
jgi:hypothetical protein